MVHYVIHLSSKHFFLCFLFTDEELDFIINYDTKYRKGRDNGNMSEE